MNIRQAILNAHKVLTKNQIESAGLDCEILLSKVLQKDRKYVILNSDKDLNEKNISEFKDLIIKRSLSKPVAHLTGKKDFWKHSFFVSDKTLIPRPDTEILIENALKITKQKSRLNILDIGTGSGCILLSILKDRSDFYGTGIDISKDCIDISKINAKNLELSDRSKFFKSDVDNLLNGKYDLIISNPPYIKKLDLKYLDKDVIDFEPINALDGGLDGISKIKKIIMRSSDLLKNNGKLVLEIAYDQKYKVKKLLKDEGYYINKIIKDYSKNDRCIISTKIRWYTYMVTFRNNNGRRNNFRRNDRNYKTNGERQKFGSNFSNTESFQRKNPGRNNHNAPKLIEKYNNLAREALSIGDKIMSENYFQHADHFSRILSEQENIRKLRYSEKSSEEKKISVNIQDKKNDSIEEKVAKIQTETN